MTGVFFLDENERSPCWDPDPPRTSLDRPFVVPTPLVDEPVSLVRWVDESITGEARERSRVDDDEVRFGGIVVGFVGL